MAIEQGDSVERSEHQAAPKPKKRYSGSFLALCRGDIEQSSNIGAPSKLDASTANRIAAAVETGVPFGAACQAAGITTKTASRWIERGNLEESEGRKTSYVAFVRLLKRSQAIGQVTLAEKVASNDDWRAQAFILERRYEAWRKTEQVANTITLSLTGEQLASLGEALLVANLPSLNKPPKPT